MICIHVMLTTFVPCDIFVVGLQPHPLQLLLLRRPRICCLSPRSTVALAFRLLGFLPRTIFGRWLTVTWPPLLLPNLHRRRARCRRELWPSCGTSFHSCRSSRLVPTSTTLALSTSRRRDGTNIISPEARSTLPYLGKVLMWPRAPNTVPSSASRYMWSDGS